MSKIKRIYYYCGFCDPVIDNNSVLTQWAYFRSAVKCGNCSCYCNIIKKKIYYIGEDMIESNLKIKVCFEI